MKIRKSVAILHGGLTNALNYAPNSMRSLCDCVLSEERTKTKSCALKLLADLHLWPR